MYGLVANLVLMGHFTAASPDKSVPKLLDLAPKDHAKLQTALRSFDRVTKVTRSYKPRVVHFYNSFQNCLKNVRFLAQILDLSSAYSTKQLVCGLQGTFIYNLTVDLATQKAPLARLEEDILEGFPQFELFQKLLDLVLKHSGRKLLVANTSTGADRLVAPPMVCVANKFAIGKGDRLWVRGGSGTADRDAFANMGDLRNQLPC